MQRSKKTNDKQRKVLKRVAVTTIPDVIESLKDVRSAVDVYMANFALPDTESYIALKTRINLINNVLKTWDRNEKHRTTEYVELRRDHEALKEKFGKMEAEIAELKLKSITKDIKMEQLEEEAAVVEAMTIVKAAEARFLDLLLTDPDERRDYRTVRSVINAVEDNYASNALCEQWEEHRKYWDEKAMRTVIEELSVTRAQVMHREDRDPERYRNMTSQEVGIKMREVVVKAPFTAAGRIPSRTVQKIQVLHNLTSSQVVAHKPPVLEAGMLSASSQPDNSSTSLDSSN